MVEEKAHQAWHKLFANMHPHQIADEINKTWLDPRFKLAVIRRY
jgi:hypothetical protein